MQSASPPPAQQAWCLHRQVFPQHTDHAGVMWHGAYLAWLEEARVEALEAAGLAYSALSRRGLELPVVHLSLTYQAPLLHGDRVEVRSRVLPRRGLRLPWQSWFMGPAGQVAAQALVELVLVDFSAGADKRRLLRHPSQDLEEALASLARGPRP
ncbi:MAG: acyl-CoA thioesterase [Cyanobacteria bacterium K_Offshore_surface_m2_239]|nr:acyl-CoA thioesterase [Cyanobacteria bacterium K_Offshore_surface_m2_239]